MPPCEADELLRLSDNNAALRCPGNGDASAAAEVEQRGLMPSSRSLSTGGSIARGYASWPARTVPS